MIIWEGGVCVFFLVCWLNKIFKGLKLNGIFLYEDVFLIVVVVLGEKNLWEKFKKLDKVYIDGENNLVYWIGKVDKFVCNYFFYYYEF